MPGPCCRPEGFAPDEFRSQLSALHVLGAAIRRNRNNLRYMRDHSGFQRVAHMLQWLLATFHAQQPQAHRGLAEGLPPAAQ